MQCCEVCGIVAHDGACARKAAQDCRPVAGAMESMVHLWQPAGTIYYDSEVSEQMQPVTDIYLAFAVPRLATWPGTCPFRTHASMTAASVLPFHMRISQLET